MSRRISSAIRSFAEAAYIQQVASRASFSRSGLRPPKRVTAREVRRPSLRARAERRAAVGLRFRDDLRCPPPQPPAAEARLAKACCSRASARREDFCAYYNETRLAELRLHQKRHLWLRPHSPVFPRPPFSRGSVGTARAYSAVAAASATKAGRAVRDSAATWRAGHAQSVAGPAGPTHLLKLAADPEQTTRSRGSTAPQSAIRIPEAYRPLPELAETLGYLPGAPMHVPEGPTYVTGAP